MGDSHADKFHDFAGAGLFAPNWALSETMKRTASRSVAVFKDGKKFVLTSKKHVEDGGLCMDNDWPIEVLYREKGFVLVTQQVSAGDRVVGPREVVGEVFPELAYDRPRESVDDFRRRHEVDDLRRERLTYKFVARRISDEDAIRWMADNTWPECLYSPLIARLDALRSPNMKQAA